MLNQPINVIPSVLSGVGEGVIDATSPLTVSWQVSGNSPMLAYEIVIQQNTDESTQMYDSGKVTLANPFYGTNYKGVQQTFSATPITASALSTAGIVNGYENGYKIIITQWWGATDADSISQTSPSVFITRATPSVSINAISPSPYNKKSISITGSYSQSDGDSISLTRWILTDNSNPSEPLVDTGDMETQQLRLDYDGLFSGGSYTVQLIVQTVNGVTANATPVTFDVSYAVSEDFGAVTACKPSGKGYIELSWESRSTIDPEETGNPTVEDGLLYLGNGDSVTYSPTPIATPWSVVWRGSVSALDGNTHNVLQMSDGAHDYVLSITSASATFAYNGNIIFTKTFPVQYPVRDSDTLVIAITPSAYHIKQVTITGGLLPLDTLYPSNTLYPSDVSQQINTYTGDITYNQTSITSVTLNGQQVCDYLWFESGELSASTISYLMGNTYYEPIADTGTMFLLTMANGTDSAYISGGGGNLLGSSIYRKEYGKNSLEHLVDVDGSRNSIRDYSAKSRTQYEYYIFEIGADTYTAAYRTATITPQYGEYTLIECIYDDSDGAYHVQAAYPFACNVDQSSISNNNSPNLLQNFTRYPNRQPVSTLYKSGTLSALIGNVNQAKGTYTDTWTLADKISALSTSNNPKFLRDMKGAIWKIETSSAITSEINTRSSFMPIKITIPWAEIGDANGCSIVAIPSDPVFGIDQIYLSTIEVDIETGNLVWTVPNNYDGTMLSINADSLVATTESDVYPAEIMLSEGYLLANV